MGKLLIVPFILICLAIVVAVGIGWHRAGQLYGPQGKPTWDFTDVPVNYDHPYYHIDPTVRAWVPAIIGGLVVLAIFVNKLSRL